MTWVSNIMSVIDFIRGAWNSEREVNGLVLCNETETKPKISAVDPGALPITWISSFLSPHPNK